MSCEHAGNEVPAEYAYLFEARKEVMQTHRAYDFGALEIASMLAENLQAPFFVCKTTRLLVEANRSLDNAQLFSEYSNNLHEEEKSEILSRYYFPYRQRVEAAIEAAKKPVLHFSVHSFTPVWEGKERDVDIGLLFDPERRTENEFCLQWQKILQNKLPELTISLNKPYAGIDDGFTTYLRKKYTADQYLGIEIEVNQKFNGTLLMDQINKALLNTIKQML
ncbi:MAG TPA: N-formylglutamate amidohydrolase [Cyclobacteriaceae bacterium]|nr:N-formylglutamate amidohydrolase [Cyclobacteriaceae bacterium]